MYRFPSQDSSLSSSTDRKPYVEYDSVTREAISDVRSHDIVIGCEDNFISRKENKKI
jgi:hypothetical protein